MASLIVLGPIYSNPRKRERGERDNSLGCKRLFRFCPSGERKRDKEERGERNEREEKKRERRERMRET